MAGAPARATSPLPAPPDALPSRAYTQGPYRPDRVRALLGFSMLAPFALTVAFLAAAAIAGRWADVREFAEVILPLEGVMLGSALTFYFASHHL
jgi:hypothetical protein